MARCNRYERTIKIFQPFRIFIPAALMLAAFCLAATAEPGRWEMNLSGDGWKLRLDRNAEWQSDELFLPPVDLLRIPSNPPSCGWDRMDSLEGKAVSVPGTVEQHYWGSNGNPLGIAGDYRGVSWWSRTFRLDPGLKGKRIVLAFDCVNLRAEIYVNRKLVGYDVIGNTPFKADITGAVIYGGENTLDIRITDPVGNFNWPSGIVFPWGKYNIPAVRGFGGITGDVTLLALDKVNIDDIYIRNSPKITEAEVIVTVMNTSGSSSNGSMTLVISEWNNPLNILWKKTISESIPPAGKTVSFAVKAPNAKPWGILDPHLYVAQATFESVDGTDKDMMDRRFGFRWFGIGEKDGDQRLYLNGKRVFIRGCKNRTYWPTNGMYASPEWAKKDVELVIEMGYNALKVTNAIPPLNQMKYCEELGVLYTGNSSGYSIHGNDNKPIDDPFTREIRREKLVRFIKRDRSSPALYLEEIKEEEQIPPDEDDYRNMEKVRELDNTRIFLYNGGIDLTQKKPYINNPDSPAKSFYKPLDPKIYTHGWWDMHHWGHAGYRDDYYTNPRNYLRLNIVDGDSTYKVLKDEIIYYGEDGSFGTMIQLGKIKKQIDLQGTSDGWREKEHLDWYKYYDSFLDEAGFRTSFPTVNHLTRALGTNLYEYHGRTLENCRISNIVDGYVINGAASDATHTDMFDVYRNPTGDPAILRYYCQPLYIAIKLRAKVMPVGTAPIADIFIVNELNLKGKQTLELELRDPDGQTVFAQSYKVDILGGEEYGQLLVEEVNLPPVAKHGRYSLYARIPGKKDVVCTGFDTLFAIDLKTGPGIAGNIAVLDNSGTIQALLQQTRGVSAEEFSPGVKKYDYIVVGTHDFKTVRNTVYAPMMEQVLNGATLIVLENADSWAREWDDVYGYQAVQYTGTVHWSNRGRLFVGKSPLLSGLPTSQAMSWEYQVFYSGDVWSLLMDRTGNETVVAVAAEFRKDILTAVARIPFGNGRIIVSTLNIMPNLRSQRPQSAVAKKLFLNFLEYAKK